MCKRIYKEYAIKVITSDEAKIIKLNGNIDKTSFKVMKDTYNKTKDRYSDIDCTVQLIGVYQDGTEGRMIYEKEFKKETTEETELLTTTNEIVENIKYGLALLTRKREYHDNMISVYDKKEQLLLHKIETIKEFKGSREDLISEKIKIFDELENNREERRFTKEERSDLQSLFRIINIDKIIREFDKVRIPINGEYEYIDGEIEEKIIKEYPYKNDRERVNLMKQLEGKYDKIVNDDIHRKIICSNKGYHKNK